MKVRHVLIISMAALPLVLWAAVARPGQGDAQGTNQQESAAAAIVRAATERFKDVEAAKAAGYALVPGCVSGPQEGAMGVHFANATLFGDGLLDPSRPEALLYEVRNGQYELLGVEYVVLAEGWHAHSEGQPVLMGQLPHYVGSPNRYGLPGFYELHVWAWRSNPRGTFADWNPTVSCDDYSADGAAQEGGH